MDKSKLELYAAIKQQISSLEEQADELRPGIVEAMQADELDKVSTEFGNFTLTQKRKWEYSENVKIAADNLEELQNEEKAKGIATYTETPVLKFLTIKSKE